MCVMACEVGPDVEAFLRAVARVAAGSGLDPEVVGRMLGRRRAAGPLDTLSPRERDVLGAMAEGTSNQGIAEALFVTEAAVEKHVTAIFQKLDLGPPVETDIIAGPCLPSGWQSKRGLICSRAHGRFRGAGSV